MVLQYFKRMKLFVGFAVVVFAAFAALFLLGCDSKFNESDAGMLKEDNNLNSGVLSGPSEQFDPGKKIITLGFSDDEEYTRFVRSKSNQAIGFLGARASMGGELLAIADSSAGVTSQAKSMLSSPQILDYSLTNVQVAGVDEADILKSDGSFIYTISGNTVFIIKAYPGEDASIVSELKFDSSPQGLFILGDKLAVFGEFSNLEFFNKFSWRPRSQVTFFNIYDVKNKKSPVLERELKVEGYYFQARLAGGFVYFVTVSSPDYRRQHPTPALIDGSILKPLPATDIHYFPIPYNQMQLATVSAISLDDSKAGVVQKGLLIESNPVMYMNEASLFITYTEYINEWEIRNELLVALVSESFNSDDKRLADKIMNADSELLSENEKKSKLLQLVYEYLNFMPERERNSIQEELESALARELKKHEFLEYTIINKIGIQKGKIDVLANGVVQGRILNQFSMDEHDQVFRIATTSTRNYRLQKEDASLNPAGLAAETKADEDEAIAPESTARIMIAPPIQRINEPSSNVFALDKDLKVVGSITGIAPSESIYSTRFVRDRLYMVTFRQVDPFFVFDLSDAKNLKALGELKIPGYSRYLHPYDESTIIGIGREASATGQVRGLKISLFDVRDVSKPKEVAKFTTPSSHANSIVEYEHKAFLFSKEKELLVIPAYSYSYDNWDPSGKRGGSGSFNGAMIFKVSKDNISLRGIVDHSQGTAYYGPAVERSLYINELLFTKSVGLLRINELSDLSSVKNLELSGFKSPYPIY